MVGWQVLSRPSAAEGGGRRPAFTGLATRPYSATEVDGWQHKLSRGLKHPGTWSMGKLLVLSLACTLAAAVLFQPALVGKPRMAADV
jgi:hypothetical protein